MTNPTPDVALLWARRKVALAYAGEASARFVAEMAAGGNDNWVVLVTAEAFRAGHSHADAGLLEALEDVTDDLEVEIEAKRGAVLARTTERDLASVKAARAAIAAAKGPTNDPV
jgi:hypothetical protein